MKPAQKFERKILLINKSFQLRFAWYVCSWLIVLSFIFPLLLFSVFNEFFDYLAKDPLGPGLAVLEKTRQEMIYLLIVMVSVLFVLAFFISIYMSHKIAGPLYKLQQAFLKAQTGQLQYQVSFRQKDYFIELALAYNAMMAVVQTQLNQKQKEMHDAAEKIRVLGKQLPAEQAQVWIDVAASLEQK